MGVSLNPKNTSPRPKYEVLSDIRQHHDFLLYSPTRPMPYEKPSTLATVIILVSKPVSTFLTEVIISTGRTDPE